MYFFFIEHHLQSKNITESESPHRMRSSDAHVYHILKCLVEVVADPVIYESQNCVNQHRTFWSGH